MDERNTPPGVVAVCTSCRQLHPDGFRCSCVVDRAEAIAREGYELHRVTVPAWRRPREWDRLPERARQDLVRAGLDLVDALEGAGWRLQGIGAEPDHDWPEDDRSATWDGGGQLVALAPESTGPFRPLEPLWPDDRAEPGWIVDREDTAAFDPALLPPVPDRTPPALPGYALAPVGRESVVPAYMHPREVITGPPMLQGVTLRDWLQHHHPTRDHVWADVVRELYTRAAATPVVASYFHEVLARPDGLEDLQRHFTAQLVMVTGQGVTVGTLRAMEDRHAHVSNEAGQGITGGIYDAVVGVLVDILAEFDVPAAGLAALAASIRPLRDVIVWDPDSTDPRGYSAYGAPDAVQ